MSYGQRGRGVDDELEDFKTRINLSEYAAAQGYVLDRRASSKNSALMRHAGGDKIVIARGADQHWIYFSVRDDLDNGSIIDFVQKRKHVKLGGARQELRPWVGASSARAPVRPQPDLFAQDLVPVSRDLAQVLGVLARSQPLAYHRWLEEARGIPRSLIQSPRFAGKLRVDARANVLFPHADQDGPCGYEIKNKGFTGFSPGGEKGLWFSAAKATDTTLVIAESGIDALSYAALFPDAHARFASIGGAMNPNQPALIAAAISRMGEGSRIVLAMDNDPAGLDLAQALEEIAKATGRTDLMIQRHRPEGAGEDWNDVLRAGMNVPAREPAAGL